MANARAQAGGGTATTLSDGLVDRAGRAIFGGRWDLWFGPGQPPPQNAPEGTEGRTFDYPYGYNLQRKPKYGEGAVSFEQLRQLSRNLDVLRTVLETRKDEVCKQSGSFAPIDGSSEDTPDDPQVKQLNDFMKYPDQEHDFKTWIRILLEEMYVLDAPAIWLRPNLAGELHSLHILDGSTIKRVIDENGCTPLPTDPQPYNIAYQQIIKGLVASQYTSDELLYQPRNPAADRVYGYSHVEQIVMTILIGLRRVDHQLKLYTHGNIPMAFLLAPDNWTPEQMRRAQVWMDQLLAGNSENRSKAIIIPNAKPEFPQKDVLKDEFDEWIARIVCYQFGVAPTPFIKQMNRATADDASESADEEGLEPAKAWLKSVLDNIARRLKVKAEWQWDVQVDVDPLKQAQTDQIYVNIGAVLPEEVRDELGYDEFTPEQQQQIQERQQAKQPQQNGSSSQNDDDPSGEGDKNKQRAKVRKSKKNFRSRRSAPRSLL